MEKADCFENTSHMVRLSVFVPPSPPENNQNMKTARGSNETKLRVNVFSEQRESFHLQDDEEHQPGNRWSDTNSPQTQI